MEDPANPTSTNKEGSRAKRKGRGKGKKGKKGEPKEPKCITFDAVDRPVGIWAGKFANDIGRIVRNNIKITYEDWSLVPEGLKDTVWKEAKKEWNINDEELREHVLKITGERLRGWRTLPYMTSYYVFKTRKQRRKVPINDPTTIYDGITKEDWALFVRQRMEEKFEEKSQKAIESQKNNLYPHYMGRTGYAGKLPQWHKEEVEAILSTDPEADPEATQKSVAKRLEDRGYAWIKGHTPKLKNPPEQTQKLIEQIKHWKRMEERSRVPCRLGVYGIDSEIFVAEGTAWPWKEGTMVHSIPLSQQNVRVSIDKILDGKSLHPVPWDENVRVADVFGSFAQWPYKSLVFLESNQDNSNGKLKNHAKSKDPKECDNDLQQADDNVFKLKKDETFEKKGPLSVDELSELGQYCQRLERNICSAILGDHSIFNIKISKLVYAYEEDVDQIMLFEDIREMFRYYCLNIAMLQVWGSFLYEFATQFKEKLPVGFLCPDKLCSYTRAPLDMEDYVTKALKKQDTNRYIMGAFREGYHWMLLVFDIGENLLYILDSS